MASGNEKRGFSRSTLDVTIEVAYASFGRASFRSRDLSASGVFVMHNGNPVPPPAGAAVDVWFKDEQGHQSRAIRAEVVRVDADGFALKFLEDPFAALAG